VATTRAREAQFLFNTVYIIIFLYLCIEMKYGAVMSNEQEHASMHAITVAREYGSGGGEIARQLAQRLHWQLLDHQIVQRVAQKLGISEDEAEAHDEHVEGFATRLLEAMQYAGPQAPLLQDTYEDIVKPVDEKAYQQALSQSIQVAAALGQVVIVGRGSQALLASHRDVLRVLIVAPLDLRISYVMKRENLDKAAARDRIARKDHERIRALKELHHCDGFDPRLYDLVINTGVLDLDSCVDLTVLALERKAQRLSLPTAELGPGAGLTSYPGQPGDIQLQTPDTHAK
jgi:cytidylate kinase